MALLHSTISADDAFLISELKRGKTAAFEQVFHKYHSAICYFCKQFVWDNEVAKDLAAEMFVKVWKNKENFESISSLKSFLYIGAKNACLNHLKAQKVAEGHRQFATYQASLEESEDVIMNRIFDAEVLREMSRAIEVLPTQCKRVLKMSLNGMKTNEIAKYLGLSEQTVRNTRVRATVMLKRHLSQDLLWVFACISLIEGFSNIK